MEDKFYLNGRALNSRRHFIARMIGSAIFLSCSPIISVTAKSKYDANTREILQSFISTVVPGSDQIEINLSEFLKPSYPFYRYIPLLVKNLQKTSKILFKNSQFEKLTNDQKTAVIAAGCEKSILNRLYKGCIWFVQVLIFTGLAYHDHICRIIDFNGNKIVQDREGDGYGTSFIRSLTTNGNLN